MALPIVRTRAKSSRVSFRKFPARIHEVRATYPGTIKFPGFTFGRDPFSRAGAVAQECEVRDEY
jgi:hypothetical protein